MAKDKASEKADRRQMLLWMPAEMWERLEALMAVTKRSMTAEVIDAIGRHLDQPPEVKTPKLRKTTVTVKDGG